jgi:hypothetical protein
MTIKDDGFTPEEVEIVVPERVEIVSETVEPVPIAIERTGQRTVEPVVVDVAPRVDPTYVDSRHQYNAPVAETRSFWSRFWWLIPLLALLIAIPFIMRGCNSTAACTALPANVWTTAQQDTTWNAVSAFDSTNFSSERRTEVLNELMNLCNRRLSGETITDANITGGAFNTFNLEAGVVTNVLNLVNGDTFCRCN